MFTLGEMECMGACVNAPMIAIADYTKVVTALKGVPIVPPSLCFDVHVLNLYQGVEGFSYIYYEDLSPSDAISIIDTIKKGGKPKVRQSCHPRVHVLKMLSCSLDLLARGYP
jgi:NADH dehydrogenase (ubiquinone) flavoprotein 2